MSNKRIDLTQFKGLTKGEWVYEEVVKGTGWVATLMIPHTGADTPEHPHGLPYPVASVTEHDYHLTRSDIKAMASVPDLIAELKRCYDLIDAQKENLEFLNGAIEKLHEETWTEAVVEFVEEHHPSEWCDYSHCWKCEEETASE